MRPAMPLFMRSGSTLAFQKRSLTCSMDWLLLLHLPYVLIMVESTLKVGQPRTKCRTQLGALKATGNLKDFGRGYSFS